MMIIELMEKQNITKYRLAKKSGVPYSTINDICSGKAQLEKCSAETIYRIAKVLGVSMESLIEPCFEKDYPNVTKDSNVNDILKTLKEKRDKKEKG